MLGDRLLKLRKARKMTQQDVADKLHISRGTYAQYEIDRRVPEYSTLEKMADFFDVSIDYMVGRSDDPHPATAAQPSKGPSLEGNAAILSEIANKYKIDLSDPVKRKQLEELVRIIAINYADDEGK